MIAESDASPETIPGTVFNSRQVRLLKIVVIAMGLLLVAGFGIVIATIVYQAMQRSGSEGEGPPTALTPELILALPANASISSITLDGDRMAVHIKGSNDSEIIVIDIEKGEVVSRVQLKGN